MPEVVFSISQGVAFILQNVNCLRKKRVGFTTDEDLAMCRYMCEVSGRLDRRLGAAVWAPLCDSGVSRPNY